MHLIPFVEFIKNETMNEIFRFILLRPPKPVEETKTILIASETHFLGKLKEAKKGTEEKTPREVMKEVAAELLNNKDMVIIFKDQYEKLFQKLLHMDENPKFDSICKAIKKIFGQTTKKVVEDERFKLDKRSLSDFLHALKITQNSAKYDIKNIQLYLRVIFLIESIAEAKKGTEENQKEFNQKGVLKKQLSKSIKLSSAIFPLPPSREGLKIVNEPAPPNEKEIKLKELTEKSQLLETSIEALMAFQGLDFKEIEEEIDHISTRSNFFKVEETEGTFDGLIQEFSRFLGTAPVKNSVFNTPTNFILPQIQPLTLKEESINRLDRSVIDLVDSYNLKILATPIPEIVSKLETEHVKVVKELANYEPNEVLKVLPLGNLTFTNSKSFPASTAKAAIMGTFKSNIPQGKIKSVGIGDLLVVKEQIKRYEGGEIAHVENVLEGEFKERSHRKLKRNEDTFILETETISEEEQELTTTERFELQKESSKILSEEVNSKSGAGFSIDAGIQGAGVGFTYYVDGNVNGFVENSTTTSSEEASRKASNFSREVTNRAASRITERTRREQIRRVIQEIEEINLHGIDNKDGDDHVIGVYQWLNKVLEAQIFNYGKRMLFDFMVPEPAAFLRKAVEDNTPEGIGMEKPMEFTLKPNQITTTNYHLYVKRYNVTGVEPPPKPYVRVSKTFNGKSPNNEGNAGEMVQSGDITVPSGYKTISIKAFNLFTTWSDSAAIDLAVSTKAHRFNTNESWHWSTNLAGVVGQLPIGLKTFRTSAYAVTVEIRCQRTDRALDKWKLKTFDAIKQQYLNLQSEYEERLAAAQIQEGIQINGRNPIENRRIEKTELKKSCLSIITDQHFGSFDSISNSPQGYPQVNIDESLDEGRIIRFFEQAFEWEHMMYVLYPYFWSRKNYWLERVLAEDTDPLHAEFLRAGSARVVVAVSENFESAVAHFLETGNIPEDDELLNINSPLYKPIVEEIRERQEAPGDEIPEGEPWDVKLPTTLVKLRDDSSLPVWRKNAEGVWKPEN